MVSELVDRILCMQKDLDAYEYSFVNIMGMLVGKFGEGNVPSIQKCLAESCDVDERIDSLFRAAKELRMEYDQMKKSYDELNELYVEAISLREANSDDE